MFHRSGKFRQASLVDDIRHQGSALFPGLPIADEEPVAQQHFQRPPHLRAFALEIGVPRHHHIFDVFRRVHEDDLPAQDAEGIDAGAIIVLDPVADQAMARPENNLKKTRVLRERPGMRRDEIALAPFFDHNRRLVEPQIHQTVRAL